MLRPIKNQHLASDGFCRDQVRILRHVPRTVDLAGMIDFLGYLNARCGWDGVPTQLSSFVVIVAAVEFVSARAFRDLNGSDLKVVLCLTGGVCAQEETMSLVRLVGW